MIYNSLERPQLYVVVCPEGLLKLVNCFVIINMIMKCSLSNVITDFYKEHPPVSIPTGLFLFVVKHDVQNL